MNRSDFDARHDLAELWRSLNSEKDFRAEAIAMLGRIEQEAKAARLKSIRERRLIIGNMVAIERQLGHAPTKPREARGGNGTERTAPAFPAVNRGAE